MQGPVSYNLGHKMTLIPFRDWPESIISHSIHRIVMSEVVVQSHGRINRSAHGQDPLAWTGQVG